MITLLAIALGIAMGAALYVIGFSFGKIRGRDEQRIKDILELWIAMPVRDSRGRFKSARASGTPTQKELI